ncbi:CDP-glycerol glycerophosphotransferase family protein [Campylobacter volucris]|uniref:CDP-glycerol glycerophosphotransferase family protein n=1 Tax=Campylobacter volucris TaxID=1031542 RepID=UPI0018A06CED|nr:CDP-glycerol glycerophosphotransferase family protein [Campylobacter volucris]MBF7045962.1 CDP-glycerol glycerophosphotransferase family protein [Campylobacter volucris]
MTYKQINTLAKILSFWLPIRNYRRKLREKILHYLNLLEAKKSQKRNLVLLEKIKNKAKNGKKVNVTFLVMYDSVFPAQKIFEMMLNDILFNASILVIPDISRSNSNMLFQLKKTFNFYSRNFPNVHSSYNMIDNTFINFLTESDIVCPCSPYDIMTHSFYQISTLKSASLVIYFDYGSIVSNWYIHTSNNHLILHHIYKYYTYYESNFSKQFKNSKICGCLKMDSLINIQKISSSNKRIIIAPHHTIETFSDISFSNFLTYHNFFLSLPKKYPQIEWIFRPHPLLFINLKNNNIWSEEKIQQYLDKFKSYKNVIYQDGGDFFDVFVNSDGLIHDCGSFMVEYLYTNHPVCYLLKDKEKNQNNFNDFALNCIDVHYKAYNENDIINFIEEVILNSKDPLKEKREIFFNQNIKYDYPNTAKKIISELKKEILK